jgi:two-component system, NtrC family, sensor kinase
LERTKNIKHINVEKTLFELLSLILFAIAAIAIIENFIHKAPKYILILNSVMSLVGLSFLLLSRYKGYHKSLTVPIMLILTLMLIIYWYLMSGIFGPMSIGAVGVTSVSIFLAPRGHAFKVLISFLLLLAFLVGSHQFTDWVQIRTEMAPIVNRYRGIYLDYYVVSTAVIYMFYFLKQNFEYERQIVLDQNVEHEELNLALQETISEREQVIKNLKLTQNQLIESEKMASIGHFTSGIAHELNNPMNFVNGSIRPILLNLAEIEEELPESTKTKYKENLDEIKMLLRNVEDGTKHISGILNNLLKITPNASDSQPMASIDLLELVRNTYHFVQNASPKMTLVLDAKDQIIVEGVPVEFNQILLNLIRNSLDATREMNNGRIEIQLNDLGSHCSILIKDNGIGIPKEHHSKIFDPFFTTKNPGEGTGVGLYIVYSLVVKYGGKIRMESEEGVGTTFTITLPLNNDQSTPTPK